MARPGTKIEGSFATLFLDAWWEEDSESFTAHHQRYAGDTRNMIKGLEHKALSGGPEKKLWDAIARRIR